jgi:hypothetical protein
MHIAHVLNHRSVTRSTVTAISDRYTYDKEKRVALDVWAGELDGIIKGKAPVLSIGLRQAGRDRRRRTG